MTQWLGSCCCCCGCPCFRGSLRAYADRHTHTHASASPGLKNRGAELINRFIFSFANFYYLYIYIYIYLIFFGNVIIICPHRRHSDWPPPPPVFWHSVDFDGLFTDLFIYLLICLPSSIQFELTFLVEMPTVTFEKRTLPARNVDEVFPSLPSHLGPCLLLFCLFRSF